MLITDVQLPVCDHCAKAPLIEKLLGPIEDGKQTTVFFVMCKSDACAKRTDNGLMTMGRPLTDGKPSLNAVEEAWKAVARTQTYRENLAKVRS